MKVIILFDPILCLRGSKIKEMTHIDKKQYFTSRDKIFSIFI